MRLSDNLQDFLVNGPNMWGPQYETIQQAYRLAKRYEDAPVESVGALPGSNGGFGAVCLPREFVGQRVRIVLDKEG